LLDRHCDKNHEKTMCGQKKSGIEIDRDLLPSGEQNSHKHDIF